MTFSKRIVVLFLAAVMVSVSGLPLIDSHQGLGLDQACSGDVPSTQGPASKAVRDSHDAPANVTSFYASALVNDLTIKLQESSSVASGIVSDVYNAWTSAIDQDSSLFVQLRDHVQNCLDISPVDHDSLSQQQTQVVRVLLQASGFALYLDNQHQEEVYGDITARLSDLKGRLQQVACAARQLLSGFSNDNIREFEPESTRLHRLLQSNTSPAVKRIVCGLALKKIVSEFNAVVIDTK